VSSTCSRCCRSRGSTAREREVQGEALLHHAKGWTALAFWDRSVDSRPGSNAVFFADAYRGFDAMLADAREHWPTIFARFGFEIIDVRALSKTREG
jgi:hypothetical protein